MCALHMTAHAEDNMQRLRLVILFATISLPCLTSALPATNKLSPATWGSYDYRDHKGPGTYAYGYEIEDPVTGNVQFKQEERHADGTITGSYGYVAPDGVPQVTHYVSDSNGYRILPEGKVVPPLVAAADESALYHQQPPIPENAHAAGQITEAYLPAEPYRTVSDHLPLIYVA